MANTINHNETLIRVNDNNELVEHPSICYDKQYVADNLQYVGTEFDEIQLIDSERLISLTDLMVTDITLYTEVLSEITLALES